MDFPTTFEAYVARVERGIDQWVPRPDERPARLHAAMRYSLEAGGKRLRPVLVLASADRLRVAPEGDRRGAPDALAAAVAIECVHT